MAKTKQGIGVSVQLQIGLHELSFISKLVAFFEGAPETAAAFDRFGKISYENRARQQWRE
jgi:hypothetical protein